MKGITVGNVRIRRSTFKDDGRMRVTFASGSRSADPLQITGVFGVPRRLCRPLRHAEFGAKSSEPLRRDFPIQRYRRTFRRSSRTPEDRPGCGSLECCRSPQEGRIRACRQCFLRKRQDIPAICRTEQEALNVPSRGKNSHKLWPLWEMQRFKPHQNIANAVTLSYHCRKIK